MRRAGDEWSISKRVCVCVCAYVCACVCGGGVMRAHARSHELQFVELVEVQREHHGRRRRVDVLPTHSPRRRVDVSDDRDGVVGLVGQVRGWVSEQADRQANEHCSGKVGS